MPTDAPHVQVGIDTGGTFTDLVSFDPETRLLSTSKTPSVPDNPGQALLDAIKAATLDPSGIGSLIHGTTVATNALIERTGGRVAFLTTKGHEDIPYIQRINRKTLYDLRWEKPKPLLKSRRDAIGIPERIGPEGQVVRPLDETAVIDACTFLADFGIEAIAVCLLFSYVNPAHELRVKEIIARELPDIPVSVSHEVAPIWREYERSSTTIADAYLKPLMRRYVTSLDETLRSAGLQTPITIMKSNGGSMHAGAAAANPIQTAQSGPAGGMLAAAAFGKQAGKSDLLTLDMGGTSADVGVIKGGQQKQTTEYEIEWGVPAAIPLIDIKSIGAGGGSIAWIDKGGFLRVGPESAGADPGPACYCRGGTRPTVTDANLVLGRLDPVYFLGGQMRLEPNRSVEALEPLANQLQMSVPDLASAIVDIANENMASAIKMVSIERGHDPRRFTLFGFGGAGPAHAAAVAKSLRIPEVLIPLFPGNASALGMLISDLRVDKVWTKAFKSNQVDANEVEEQFSHIRKAAIAEMRAEGFSGEPTIEYSINMRYLGQNYEHEVPIPTDAIREGQLQQAYDAFIAVHEKQYGYSIENEIIELVSFRVTATGSRQKPSLALQRSSGLKSEAESRDLYYRNTGSLTAAIYRRYELEPGTILEGPCVLEEPGSTTVVEPGMSVEVLEDGQLLISTGVA